MLFRVCSYYMYLNLFAVSRSWKAEVCEELPKRHDDDAHKKERIGRISKAVKEIIENVGEDVEREGLVRTPDRFAKAMLFFTNGYTLTLKGNYYYYDVTCSYYCTTRFTIVNNLKNTTMY